MAIYVSISPRATASPTRSLSLGAPRRERRANKFSFVGADGQESKRESPEDVYKRPWPLSDFGGCDAFSARVVFAVRHLAIMGEKYRETTSGYGNPIF